MTPQAQAQLALDNVADAAMELFSDLAREGELDTTFLILHLTTGGEPQLFGLPSSKLEERARGIVSSTEAAHCAVIVAEAYSYKVELTDPLREEFLSGRLAISELPKGLRSENLVVYAQVRSGLTAMRVSEITSNADGTRTLTPWERTEEYEVFATRFGNLFAPA